MCVVKYKSVMLQVFVDFGRDLISGMNKGDTKIDVWTRAKSIKTRIHIKNGCFVCDT